MFLFMPAPQTTTEFDFQCKYSGPIQRWNELFVKMCASETDRQTERYVGRRTDGHAVICLIRIRQTKMNIPVMSLQFVY